MNNLLNKYEALEAALQQARLNPEDVSLISCRIDGVYYVIELLSNWMRYECYVGVVSGELRGLDYEPCLNLETENYENCAELLAENTAHFAA